MKIIGIDFTSAPSSTKPITCLMGSFHEQEHRLDLEVERPYVSFNDFSQFLNEPGEWIAALDFPFGLPQKLLKAWDWPETWEAYVKQVKATPKAEYEARMLAYQANQPPGQKQHFRPTDRATRSSSPMKLHYTPVGKMFYEGAPRLLDADIDIIPCRRLDSPKIALEGYPALIARRFGKSYKTDDKNKRKNQHLDVRSAILKGIQSPEFQTEFGFSITLPTVMQKEMLNDPTGDRLDAALCAIQAAWAYTRRHKGYGVHKECHPNDGWIIDPRLEHIDLSLLKQ